MKYNTATVISVVPMIIPAFAILRAFSRYDFLLISCVPIFPKNIDKKPAFSFPESLRPDGVLLIKFIPIFPSITDKIPVIKPIEIP